VFIHGHFDINFDVVWETVTEDLPPLIVQLKRLYPIKGHGKIPEKTSGKARKIVGYFVTDQIVCVIASEAKQSKI
jgi:hypothetical protein